MSVGVRHPLIFNEINRISLENHEIVKKYQNFKLFVDFSGSYGV